MTTAPLDRSFDDVRKTIGEYVTIVLRRWRLAVLAIGIVSSAALWYSQYLPREYASRTMFERRDDIVVQNLIHTNSPYSFGHLKSSLKRDVTGPRALARAAVDVGLLPADAFSEGDQALTEQEQLRLDAALGAYHLNPSVRLASASTGLDVIEVSCSASDPEVARQVVIALRDNYIERTQRLITDVLKRSQKFFQEELSRYETQVAEASEAIQADFVAFPGVDPTNPSSIGMRVETLRTERDRLHERVTGLEHEIKAREEFLATAAPAFIVEAGPAAVSDGTASVGGAAVKALERNIASVELEIGDMTTRRRMTPEHPSVKALQVKLDALRGARDEVLQSLHETAPTTQPDRRQSLAANVSPAWRSQQMRVEMELEALKRQLDAAVRDEQRVNKRFDEFAALYERLVDHKGEFRRWQDVREQAAQNANVWRGHLAKLERVLAAQSEERGTQFSLVQEPMRYSRPIKPKLSAIFFVCLGVGVAVSVLVIALAELLDRSFRSVSQVTRSLGIPVMECIGVIETPKEVRRRHRRRLLWTPALSFAVVALATTAGLAYISIQKPALHRKAIAGIDRACARVGLPGTQIVGPAEMGTGHGLD